MRKKKLMKNMRMASERANHIKANLDYRTGIVNGLGVAFALLKGVSIKNAIESAERLKPIHVKIEKEEKLSEEKFWKEVFEEEKPKKRWLYNDDVDCMNCEITNPQECSHASCLEWVGGLRFTPNRTCPKRIVENKDWRKEEN